MVLGIVYYDLSMSNLQAIQNRLGAFLLSCVFLCFTSVSALPVRSCVITCVRACVESHTLMCIHMPDRTN